MIASPFIRILERAPQWAALRNGCKFPLYYYVERGSEKSTRSRTFLQTASLRPFPGSVAARRPYVESVP